MAPFTPVSTRTDVSIPEIDAQTTAPFRQDINKSLTILAHNNLKISPGLKREDMNGNPVFIGNIHQLAGEVFQHNPCATGDLDDKGQVFITVNDRNWFGCRVSNEEGILQDVNIAMDNYSETRILEELEVPREIWQDMTKSNPEELDALDEREKADIEIVRDHYFDVFANTIKRYIKQTVLNARERERENFRVALRNLGQPGSLEGIRDIYRRCGFDRLVDMPAKEFVIMAKQVLVEEGMEDFAGTSR